MENAAAGDRPEGGRATCYHGLTRWAEGRMIREVFAHDATTGWRAPLVHIVTHAPISGLSWGRAGAGAADLARSLLIDALGGSALCPACAGQGRVVWKGPDADEDPEPYHPRRHAETDPGRITPCLCSDGFRALPYQDLKLSWVASLPDHWKITRDELLRWLLDCYQFGEVPGWLLDACGVDDVPLPEPS
jgi:hypothetical protein